MNKITFENIYTLGHNIFENDLYKHFHYPEMLVRYDSNFIEFKEIPSLTDFKDAEFFLRDFHVSKGQKHVKFYFPDNEKPTEALVKYLKGSGYDFGHMELYVIQPRHFPSVDPHQDIEVRDVTVDNFETYLTLQYQQDSKFGEEFAKGKVNLYKQNLTDPNFHQIMAYFKGVPAGSVEIIIAEDTAEIDGLDVMEQFQKKGIGSRLQKSVMDSFPDKTVILVADGDDTPREMYKRQGYTYQGFKYEAQKIYTD
ncbi:GNAT family N-acetyltransferase [Virgibacillus sp. DJP39]|uniref:GNAT family N-acetyltransferase n=1 Tax=Virgibacillus sp. DJP39 TaxID=3409790 RepID=UPI003BB7DB01